MHLYNFFQIFINAYKFIYQYKFINCNVNLDKFI